MTRIDDGPRRPPMPDELRRWNWGAFLLNWIWGIGNNTFIALLCLVPGVGIVMAFVLGAKGNAWAWRNGRWDDVAHFRRVQRRWAMWGFIIAFAVVGLFGALFGGLFYALKSSDAYRLGVERLEQSRAATALLGSPIATGFPMGSIGTSGSSGRAALDFSATGPKGSGRVTLQAVETGGTWALTGLRLRMDGGTEAIDLLPEDHAALRPGRAPAVPPPGWTPAVVARSQPSGAKCPASAATAACTPPSPCGRPSARSATSAAPSVPSTMGALA